DALRAGLPRCSGAALGMDRLAMLLLGKETIADVTYR
ncbi:MAG: elongation factor P lysine(34) lysyltransferase, partial [Deltaproteobacteria bacterium]|nr:elongation factor P lysine(34) lysyltransferase [Deltaproteobacteria bacterium]